MAKAKKTDPVKKCATCGNPVDSDGSCRDCKCPLNVCVDCNETFDDNGVCQTNRCVNNPATTEENVDPDGLEAQRYRLTLEKALKRLPSQIKNLVVADLDVILDEFDKIKPIKLAIPMMAHLQWNGEEFTMESNLTVKRLPRKFEHGTETIGLGTMIPGFEDLEFGED